MKHKAYINDKKTNKAIAAITVDTDGYLTALEEAHRLCKNNYPECYVSLVEKI